MGHEVVIYGMIGGAFGGGHDREEFLRRNKRTIHQLPRDDDWPWLVRSMFTLPQPRPLGTYMEHVIHFGLSLKDQPPQLSSVWTPEQGWSYEARECAWGWMEKFERLLRKLYWYRARLHFDSECQPELVFEYSPTSQALDAIWAEDPQPISTWELEVRKFSRDAG
jgi:hypothetical protein